MHRVLIEFVVDVPNSSVAHDVETRLAREHAAYVHDMLRSVTGYDPLSEPGRAGISVALEPVTWSSTKQEWVGDGDDDDDDDDD